MDNLQTLAELNEGMRNAGATTVRMERSWKRKDHREVFINIWLPVCSDCPVKDIRADLAIWCSKHAVGGRIYYTRGDKMAQIELVTKVHLA